MLARNHKNIERDRPKTKPALCVGTGWAKLMQMPRRIWQKSSKFKVWAFSHFFFSSQVVTPFLWCCVGRNWFDWRLFPGVFRAAMHVCGLRRAKHTTHSMCRWHIHAHIHPHHIWHDPTIACSIASCYVSRYHVCLANEMRLLQHSDDDARLPSSSSSISDAWSFCVMNIWTWAAAISVKVLSRCLFHACAHSAAASDTDEFDKHPSRYGCL